MRTLIAAFGAAFALSIAAPAFADENPTYSGPVSPSEASFVKAIQADLSARFATVADAEKAGYVRYTAEDDTGAISYANQQWQSTDAKHPSQLWYNVNGNLLGADFSIPNKGNARPVIWGINPGRWYEFDAHMHWVSKDPATGKLTYDQWTPVAKFVAAGGDPSHPDAATLVKMGKVKDAANVTTIFEFPSVWDLIVWVKPNPSGAFADKNPTVTPSTAK